MRRFAFRLERVARIRQIERDRARGEWVAAAGAQAAVERRLAEVRQAAQAEAAGIVVGRQAGPDEVRATAFRAGLRAQVAQLAAADLVVAAEITMQRATALQEADRSVRGLERLEDRSREQWRAEVQREEGLTADDVAGTRAAAAAIARSWEARA